MLDCETKNDVELVKLVLKDQDYFSCLMKRYETKLINYIRRISNFSLEDAEDILQEVFMKVYQNLNNFDESFKFSSWIYSITHNEVISHFRKTKSRPQKFDLDIKDDILENIISDMNVEKDADNNILKERIKKVFSNMNIKYREVLILKFIEGNDYNEISDIIKKPKGTVGTLINRAKKQFQDKFKN
ncbi:MAG: sigma-70 family RNA polymerase sigma factor [Patescibacteria group bacterium]|nr:sigma-70 family RNA polymerase sigma factor [Patescibacteria group bacterium]MDD4304131.1 sigma-70 family RNA polymerase sigma factor [Patescibacteria group bacterium]MDD4695162.1 sigma-70 family RNA polymerase sigma factor [Patescibacteria group bacterium]